MSLLDKRHFRPSGVLQDIAYNNQKRREETGLLREYDRSTKWIYIGSGSGAPAFQNSWVNYDSGASGNQFAAFMRDAAGIVHVRGLIKSGANNTIPFTFPEGFRPALAPGSSSGYIRLPIICGALFGFALVAHTGTIQVTGGDVTWVDLAGISFPAEL